MRTASEDRASEEIELGTVTGVFGFRGEVRLHMHNPDSDLLARPTPIVLVAPDGSRRVATVSTRSGAGRRILGRIAGVTDEAGAAALRGYRLLIDKAALPELGEDEYYIWQLEGAAVHVGGEPVGEVLAVQEAGPHDVLEILPAGERESVFVPVLREFVERVDAEARVVHLVPGALDEG